MTAWTLQPHPSSHYVAALRSGARGRMARALGVGTAAVLAMFLSLIPVLSRLAPPAAVVMPEPPPFDVSDYRIPDDPPPRDLRARIRSRTNGEVIPVQREPLEREPREDLALPAGPEPTGGGSEPADERTAGNGIRVDDVRPEPGTWIDRDEEPVLVVEIKPVYPELAIMAGVEGTVHVHAYVGRDGRVVEARVARSVTLLDQAALEAVRRFVFKPAYSAGRPVGVWVVVPIRFRLH